jgi:hypothetical protein
MEAMRVRRQRRRHPPDARGGHLGSAATSSGFTVDLWEEGRAHPTWDHHGGVSPTEQPELVVEFRGASAQGAILQRRMNQAWTGTDQVRFYKLEGDKLTISSAPSNDPDTQAKKSFIASSFNVFKTQGDMSANRPLTTGRILVADCRFRGVPDMRC